jgi:hypothetical protein
MDVYSFLFLFIFLPFALVLVCPVVSWFCLLKERTNSTKRTLFIGGLSSLIGNLIWPAGYLIVDSFGNSAPGNGGGFVVVLLGILFPVSMAIGAAITTTLTIAFPDPAAIQRQDDQGSPKGIE